MVWAGTIHSRCPWCLLLTFSVAKCNFFKTQNMDLVLMSNQTNPPIYLAIAHPIWPELGPDLLLEMISLLHPKQEWLSVCVLEGVHWARALEQDPWWGEAVHSTTQQNCLPLSLMPTPQAWNNKQTAKLYTRVKYKPHPARIVYFPCPSYL